MSTTTTFNDPPKAETPLHRDRSEARVFTVIPLPKPHGGGDYDAGPSSETPKERGSVADEETTPTRASTVDFIGVDLEAPSPATVCLPAKYLKDGRMLLEKGHGVVYLKLERDKFVYHGTIQEPTPEFDIIMNMFQSKITESYLRFRKFDGIGGCICGYEVYNEWRKTCEEFKARLNDYNYKVEVFSKIYVARKYRRETFEELFVFSPVGAIPYMILSPGRVILGEGFGIKTVRIHDFALERPDKLATIDSDLWHEFSSKIVPLCAHVRSFDKTLLFTNRLVHSLLAVGVTVFSILLPVLVPSYDFVMFVTVLSFWPLYHAFFTFLQKQCALHLKHPILSEVDEICNDFMARFQENGYEIELFKEKELIVFSPPVQTPIQLELNL